MQKFTKPKKNVAPPVSDQTAEDYFAEIDLKFEKYISEMAALLEWKKETVAGLIFSSLDKFYWRGCVPVEIAAQQHYWQTAFGYTSRKLRRETFLSNV